MMTNDAVMDATPGFLYVIICATHTILWMLHFTEWLGLFNFFTQISCIVFLSYCFVMGHESPFYKSIYLRFCVTCFSSHILNLSLLYPH